MTHAPLLHNGAVAPRRRQGWRRLGLLVAGVSTVLLQWTAVPAWAGDPFRPNDPHAIGDKTEAAFYAFFREGDYRAAKAHLNEAGTSEVNDPMYHSLLAAIAYLQGDWDGLLQRAQFTQQAADSLIDEDPLRGHLYKGVGIFLEGAHVLQTQGMARGTPRALGMLQQVFSNLEAAAQIDPEDPELNLIKGYMDLLLAVNLPFSDPEEAIHRLDQYAYPPYVSQRGIALGYRDLGEYDRAIAAVDAAIAAAPENPDLLYLKAQILGRMERGEASYDLYNEALTYAPQLLDTTVGQLITEQCRAVGGNGCGDRRQAYLQCRAEGVESLTCVDRHRYPRP